MSIFKNGIFILGAKRTPFGTFGGKLRQHTPSDLGEIAVRAALSASKVPAEKIDTLVLGNVIHSTTDTPYSARHIALRCGIPVAKSAYAVNRLCGSGFQAVASAANELALGSATRRFAVAAGVESMSLSPFTLSGNSRFGHKLGTDWKLEDALWNALTDQYSRTAMGETAEKLADKYSISREQCEEYAFLTQQRWKAANDGGRFKEEMAPVTLKTPKKGTKEPEVMSVDEHPRPDATRAQMAKLPPVFRKTGTVTAATASGINDGAGALVLASEEALAENQKLGLKPLARVVGWEAVGCEPTIMGIGPAGAIRSLLKAAQLSADKIDLFEVNEAFAAQYLAVEKELGLPRDRTNVNGGGIAVGHPLAASGSRISAHLVHELRRRNGKYAVGSACIGGGQGIAVLFEKI